MHNIYLEESMCTYMVLVRTFFPQKKVIMEVKRQIKLSFHVEFMPWPLDAFFFLQDKVAFRCILGTKADLTMLIN
jgi:hypothetical protein